MPPHAFRIFSWRRPFLPALKEYISFLTDHCPGRALVVVPHNRPWRYLLQLYQGEGRSGLLPRVMTLTEVLTLWRIHSSRRVLYTANTLDQVALLRQCVTELSRKDALLARRFADMDMAAFLPWGMRLAALLDELFGHAITAADMAHAEGEVAPPAAALLNALGRLQQAYAAALEERGWTTPGYDARQVALHGGEHIPPLLLPRPDRPVLLAGFALLTPTEDRLLRLLWDRGAQVCLHTDPVLARGGRPHWSCEEQAHWMQRWQAGAVAVCTAADTDAGENAGENTGENPGEDAGPRWQFFAGYDVHSQLAALRQDLLAQDSGKDAGNVAGADAPVAAASAPDDPADLGHDPEDEAGEQPATAVVLTHNGLLLPVLHHLPHKNVNVSMGYPLERSPLYRLLESLFRLQEHRTGDGRYLWRDLLECLRHPYLAMLQEDAGESGTPSPELRAPLAALCRAVRSGSRTCELEELLESCAVSLPDSALAALRQLTDVFFGALLRARTTGELAEALERLCRYLQEHGPHIWPRYPLDAEAMYRLREHAIPVLRENALCREVFDQRQLFVMARELFRQERIPFEAVPLTGLQVLGMLETRLLHFDHVYILDATDESLPGSAPQDPLLPDSLRLQIGLPDARRRERAAAHTLFRLCAGARRVFFYWQEGISRSALFDARKSRSRFVEQLIWQEEQRRGGLLRPGDAPLRVPACSARPRQGNPLCIERSPRLDEAMQRFLGGALSPTALDTYLNCPRRFVLRYLCALDQVEEVNEGDDPALVGTLVHELLEELYTPFVGQAVRAGDFAALSLEDRLEALLRRHPEADALPPESRIMLEVAVPYRLRNYLNSQPDSHVVALEQKLRGRLPLWGQDYAFGGKADRIDRREGLFYLIDYKTGSLHLPDAGLWVEEAFWSLLRTARSALLAGHAQSPEVEQLLEEMRQRVGSVQLPCYVSLLHAQTRQVGNACLVELRDSGRERELFSGLLDEADYALALERCRDLLAVMVWHMAQAASFPAREGDGCTFCPYRTACRA